MFSIMRDIKIGPIYILTERTAGRLTVSNLTTTIHFLPKKKKDRFWGIQTKWYDGPITYIGFGPFLLIIYYPQ